ncbi:MAG: hypothetical protein H6Q70_2218 [Firmicutes bacterium]|nr:hypothetical protein [Bacillota bacterium]
MKKSLWFKSILSIMMAVALLFQFSLFASAAETNKVVLKLDRADADQLPRNYRTTDDAFRTTKDGQYPSRVGLKDIHASASSIFSEKEFEQVMSRAHGQVIVVDLRQESHGYLNGMAVSWFGANNWGNDGKNLEQVKVIEKGLLDKALAETPTTIYHFDDDKNVITEPFQVNVESALTEEEMVKSHGASYFRLACSDHFRPEDADVDRFLEFYKSLPKDAWLHFHCFAGEGRTTIFMNMYDILKNAKKVSYDDIALRQGLIGPVDIRNVPASKMNWKRKAYIERAQFVKHFYDFVKQSPDNLPMTWSKWARQHSY